MNSSKLIAALAAAAFLTSAVPSMAGEGGIDTNVPHDSVTSAPVQIQSGAPQRFDVGSAQYPTSPVYNMGNVTVGTTSSPNGQVASVGAGSGFNDGAPAPR
jgi:hypothetical protein